MVGAGVSSYARNALYTVIRIQILITVIVLLSFSVLADIDHAGTDWNITANTTIQDYHFNISTFYVAPNVTVSLVAFNNNGTSGFAIINATRIIIAGNIIGDGMGYGGGSGGGGGGGEWSASGGWGGGGGTSTDALGGNGASGMSGDTYQTNNAPGGYGGAGYISIDGGSTSGSAGTVSPANADNTTSINASFGRGGGGGAGGYGGRRSGGNGGGGGGGGGMGGDGGAYVVLIAKSNILLNGTLNFRSGQLSNGNCILASAGGGGGAGVGGAGGSGAANRVANCAATSGSSGGVGYAGLGQPGGTGGNGGAGAGGSVVIAGYDLALAGSTINVSGGLNNGGTIKLLYANTLQNNGSYDGQSSLVVSKINDDWFQAPPDAELMARTAILQGANTSVLGANYAYFSDHWLAIRLANGTQYAARFDLFIKSGNKRWAFNYDPNNAGALPAFANITPVLYVWQRINLTSSNITNDVSAFINNTN